MEPCSSTSDKARAIRKVNYDDKQVFIVFISILHATSSGICFCIIMRNTNVYWPHSDMGMSVGTMESITSGSTLRATLNRPPKQDYNAGGGVHLRLLFLLFSALDSFVSFDNFMGLFDDVI